MQEVKRLDVDGNVNTIKMAYVQNNNPFEKCCCGKRKSTMKMKSPMKGKISASCKAQAKKKFKVWPSAYASGWGVRCTRGDFKKK